MRTAPYAEFTGFKPATHWSHTMSDVTRIATTYIDTWNADDETQRRRLLRQHWTDDATYVDPLMRGAGAQQISGLVGAVHERFPGFRFALIGTPNGHGDYVRLSW